MYSHKKTTSRTNLLGIRTKKKSNFTSFSSGFFEKEIKSTIFLYFIIIATRDEKLVYTTPTCKKLRFFVSKIKYLVWKFKYVCILILLVLVLNTYTFPSRPHCNNIESRILMILIKII
jgi:hypothetical protein